MLITSQTIRHRYYAQDPLAEQLSTTEMEGDGVSNDRLVMSDGENPIATPDEDGNMLYLPKDPRFAQVQTFVAADRTLDFFERHLERPVQWAFGGETMKIHPHAGEVLNAFYSREDGSINFARHNAVKYDKVINLAHSAEVVAHESGHALLDAVRPEWLATLEDATGGYHESIGDILAFLTDLEVPRNLDKLMLETGGDLRKDNSVARLAEEVGRVYHDELGWEYSHRDYLRNAVNGFINQDPETLPWDPPSEDHLGRQVHNYCRVFTGATWDLLRSFSEQYQAQGFEPREAIVKARDTVGSIVVRGIEFSPVGALPSYGHMAGAMLAADGGRHADTIRNVYAARNIHPAETPPPPPGLTLPEDGRTPFGAERFLALHREALGVGDTPLNFLRAHSNERGETFLAFGSSRDLPLKDDIVVEAQAGLLLAFNAEGELFYSNYNPVTPEREKALLSAGKALLENGEVLADRLYSASPTAEEMFAGGGRPLRGYLAFENGRVVLKPSQVRD